MPLKSAASRGVPPRIRLQGELLIVYRRQGAN